jgi:hypothetical protein
MLTLEQKKAIASICAVIDEHWKDRPHHKIDWLRLEDVLDVILREGGFPDTIKVKLAREAIDAWTRRGHFVGGSYINRADYDLSL